MESLKNFLKKYSDNLYIGLTLGIIIPIVTLIIVYFYVFNRYKISEFLYFLKTMNILSKLLSLCVVPNLLLFFSFIWTKKDSSAKGVLVATFVLAFLVILLKLKF